MSTAPGWVSRLFIWVNHCPEGFFFFTWGIVRPCGEAEMCFFRDFWKCGTLKCPKVCPNILESPERWIHSSNCQDYFAKGLIPKCNHFCPVGRFQMSPLNQKDSRWNVLCGLRTKGLNTVEDIVRGLQRFCRSPIKANEAHQDSAFGTSIRLKSFVGGGTCLKPKKGQNYRRDTICYCKTTADKTVFHSRETQTSQHHSESA